LIAIDVDEDKLALARKVGADICINPAKEDAVAAVMAATGGRGVQLTLECAGSTAGRDLSMLATAKQGTVMFYGIPYGDVTFGDKAFARMLRGEQQLVGSWNSYSLPFPGKEWLDIIALLRTNRLLVEPLISHRASLDDAPAIFKALKSRSFGAYHKILFKPNG